jgi:hypothetical protein
VKYPFNPIDEKIARIGELSPSESEIYLENGIFFQPMDEAKRQQLLDVFEKVKAGG